MRWHRWLAILPLLSCTDTTDAGSAIVQVQVLAPLITTIDVSDTTRLFARSIDLDGNVVPAPIEWVALDTTVQVDQTGLVQGDFIGLGRVQAKNGTLLSLPVNLTVLPRPDTVVIVGEDTVRVQLGEGGTQVSGLVARLDSYQQTDTIPANGGLIIYEVVEPVFTDPTQRSVEFTGQVLVDTITTGSDGTPIVPILLNRVAGILSPDSAIVAITGLRFRHATDVGGGVIVVTADTVPGSGQRFIVRFDNN
jgi:hypothetical protein